MLVNSALAAIHNIAPKDVIARSLALQGWSLQRLAAVSLGKAADPRQTDEQVNGHVNRATKLLRCFSQVVETLDRHHGTASAQQSLPQMIVENVHVNSGGQAIVGPVERPDPGKVSQNGEEKKLP